MKRYKATLRPLERYGDPRYCQVDVDAPQEEVKHLIKAGGGGILANPDDEPPRVMPLRDAEKLCRLLQHATKLAKGVDMSHFWVSGYYAVYFQSRSPLDRKRMKAIVVRCVEEAGGFMTAEEWYSGRSNQGTRFAEAHGTGSGMQVTLGLNPAYL